MLEFKGSCGAINYYVTLLIAHAHPSTHTRTHYRTNSPTLLRPSVLPVDFIGPRSPLPVCLDDLMLASCILILYFLFHRNVHRFIIILNRCPIGAMFLCSRPLEDRYAIDEPKFQGKLELRMGSVASRRE